jgi:hypothetical protein
VKRPVLLAFFVLAAGLLLAADNYTVQSVSGKVERNVSANKWEAVVAGMTLAPSTVVDVGLQALLILSDGDQTVTIRPRQKGTIETLLNSGSGLSSGVRMTAESVANRDERPTRQAARESITE